MKNPKLLLKRMGVMNITPNSFSDGGELDSPEKILERIQNFGEIHALDIGAESTAPMNKAISSEEEWERLVPYLPLFKTLPIKISLDTYHPETVFKFAEYFQKAFIWNDVSGKFDAFVERFLDLHEENQYVFCHNLAPSREVTSLHMNYLSQKEGEDFLLELADFFRPYKRKGVILDPCLGFSKTYEQNWFALEHFGKLQELVQHNHWLLGFSKKSFLRRKLGLEKGSKEGRDELDQFHQKILSNVIPNLTGELWIRTHRPELLREKRFF